MSEISSNPTNQQKWKCEYCTYENFPLSMKCTMCKGHKPSLLNEDIFRLSPTQQLSPTKKSNTNLASSSCSSSSSSNSNSNNSNPSIENEAASNAKNTKWQCPQCTYLNSTQNRICVECNSRDTESAASSDLLSEQIKGLKICQSDSGVFNKEQNTASAVVVESEAAKQSSPTTSRLKWMCSICTYENWPKSLKCSMCLHSREMPNSNLATNHIEPSPKVSPEIEDNNIMNVASNIVTNNRRNHYNQDPINNCDTYQQERQMRHLRRGTDWLNACIGVVENNIGAVESYLACGGNPGRALTPSEVNLLSHSAAFDVGHTLIHLAIRFHRDEMLPMLLAQISGAPGIKRVPSYVAPDLATDIRRHFGNSLRIRKASFNCHYVHEHATFSLPGDIEELPLAIQEQLYEELLDRDAQKQLEMPPPALNWSLEITDRLGSRLMVLWNRSAGDCLLDSAMQATWGVFDRDNTLRRALADSLHQCCHYFYPRWKENELIQAAQLHYTLADRQLEEDWTTLLSLASHPGSSLEQLHIFALAHILRRPIIVYGVKYVKSFRGEDIGYARFEGVYLPLLWEQSFCITSPIALGYTRGHFSALVPTEPYSRLDSARDDREDITFLPLMDCEMKLLPIHFLVKSEMGREEAIIRQWLDVCETEGGLLVAQQKLHKRPLLVAQMLEEWLNHYRRIAISRLF